MDKLLFYDVETMGLDYKKNSIIQLSAIIETGGAVKKKLDYNVRPHPKAIISDQALKANGHARDQLEFYTPMDEVLGQLKRELKGFVDPYDKTDKFHLVGYNNRKFDDFFFRMLFDLCGDTMFGSWFWSDSWDVMVFASRVLKDKRSGMPSFKLHRVAKTLGIFVDDTRLHDSMYDVELTRMVYYRLFPNDDIL